MSVRDQRQAAIAASVGRIREIENGRGVTRRALEAIKRELLGLADRVELFPIGDFPPSDDDRGFDALYRLSEDADHRFALYASTGSPGKSVPPHNHTTWAVIVGLHGNEQNVFYERTDDGATDGEGTLRETGGVTVNHGAGTAMMPDDIHSIHITDSARTVHLHMYGLGLEQLHSRVMYNRDAGTYKVFPASQNIQPDSHG